MVELWYSATRSVIPALAAGAPAGAEARAAAFAVLLEKREAYVKSLPPDEAEGNCN